MTMKRFTNEEIYAVKNVIKNSPYLSGFSNQYLGGEEIQKFEQEFARFHNCKYGISVNSGTSALLVSEKASGISHKTNVAIPCITFTSTTSQILACGATPNFIDIDPNSYCMDYDFSNKSISHAIPVHLLGHPCKFEMIKKMKEENIFVIEDCAQAMGAKYKGKKIGSIGDCAIFSFQETKHITTLGEGGMIITNNEEFAEKCRKIRNHGEYYQNDDIVGYNFRMTESQAAFGRVQLKKLPKFLTQFNKNANFIFKHLPNEITPPIIPKFVDHAFLICGCRFNDTKTKFTRDSFISAITKSRKKFLGIETKSDIKGMNFKPGKIISAGNRVVQYDIPLYKKFSPKKKCQNGEQYLSESIFLDIHRWRSKSEIIEELNIIEKTLSLKSK
jgi:perosamine synthetase